MYNNPINDPSIPNESKQNFYNRKAERNIPENPPTLSLQYYQPRPPQKPRTIDPAAFDPTYGQGIAYPPQMLYGYPQPFGYPPMNIPPIIKNIQINTDGPVASHQRIGIIYEDALSTKPFAPTLSSIGERLSVYQVVRSSVFNNADGNDISLDGKTTMYGGGTNKYSLLSFVKFGELNPYNTYKLSPNPYKGLPDGFLIYRSCYPIRHDSGSGSTTCSKDSTGVNVRIYKLLEGSFLFNRLDKKKYSNYDEWRELAFYEYIRETIFKKKSCPHFVTLFGYFIAERCGIDFDQVNLIKYGEKPKTEPEYIYTDIPVAKGDKRKAMEHPPLLKQYSNSFNNETVLAVPPFMTNASQIAKREESTGTIFKTSWANSVSATKIVSADDKNIRCANSEGSILDINPNAYTGKVLVMLTESPTYNIINWATKTYQSNGGNVKQMINRGTHDENEWMNILFQTMVALYVMQLNNICIKNFSFEENVLIKDLTLRGTVTNYWKYKIDDMDFYLPNLGYLVMIDSNYKDVNNVMDETLTFSKSKTNTSKIDGEFLGSTRTNDELKDCVFEMFKNTFNSNIFDREFEKDGGARPPAEIIKLLDEIMTDTSNAKTPEEKSIKTYIVKYMKKYLHNRVGTYLKDSEITSIRREDGRPFVKGQIAVYEDGHGSYKFVIFCNYENGTDSAKIITKNDGTNDLVFDIVNSSMILNYSKAEPIMQTFRQNEANMNEDDLLETYIVK